MASKSRLGRGLGALFPTLPGEEQLKEDKQPEQPQQPRKVTDENLHEGPISPLSSTIPSMGEMTRNGETVNKLSAPMTLQPEAAEHKPVKQDSKAAKPAAAKTDASKKTGKSKRPSMPALGDMAHPSDMFFDGTPMISFPGVSAGKSSKIGDSKEGETAEVELKPVEGGYLVELDVNQIGPNLYQPRTVFREEELHELSESIKEVGVLQPIVVRKRPLEQIRAASEEQRKRPVFADDEDSVFADRMDSEFELVMGERRWRASQLAGLKTIPAIVKTTADDYMLRDALLENLHRVALNPLEEAAAYQQMIDEFGLTQMQLAQSVSKSRPQIANTLRLMNLPASVQKHVAAGELSAGHARALLGLPSQDEMVQLAERIIAEGLSVRSVEEIVSMRAKEGKKDAKPKTNRHNPWAGSPMQQSLEQRFSTKVSIKGTEKHGRIEIVFSSPEEMERIMSILVPEE